MKFVKNDDYSISINNNSIYIYNYIKIIDINYSCIKLLLNKKEINVNGNDLIIKKLENNEVLIEGVIKGIEFIEI